MCDRDVSLDRFEALSSRSLSARWRAPLNISQVREELVRSVCTNSPDRLSDFVYDRNGVRASVEDWSLFLNSEALGGVGHIVLSLVREEVYSRIGFARACLAGDAEFTEFQQSIYGWPDERTLSAAWSILDGVGQSDAVVADRSEKPVDAIFAKSAVECALRSYGIAGWSVAIADGMAAKAAVNGRKNRVAISSRLRCSLSELDRLLSHEVGGHVLRWENSRCQRSGWLAQPLGASVFTEEGFALVVESDMGVWSSEQMRIYAARVVAVDMARRAGAIEIARDLSDLIGLSSAVDVALRVKRGLVNPNGEGGFLKDWGYLGGLLRVEEVVGRDPADRDVLAATKWGVDLLPQLRSMREAGLLIKPRWRPSPERLGLLGGTSSRMAT